MAEQLKSFDFTGTRHGSGSKYDQYLDGNIYRLVVGEDIPSRSIRTYFVTRAKKRGLKLRSQAVADGLVIQAYTPNDESA